MDKLFLVCSFFFSVSTISLSQVEFSNYSTNAQNQAKKLDKPILIKFTASWCGACKMMKKDVLSDKNVGDYYNNNFICTEVDVDRSSVGDRYDISGIPAYVFIDGSGKLVYQTAGYHEIEEFLSLGKRIVAKHNGTLTTLDALEMCYSGGTEDCNGKLDEFLRGEEWKSSEGIELLLWLAGEGVEKALNHFYENTNSYVGIAGQEEVDLFLTQVAIDEVSEQLNVALEKGKEPEWSIVEKSMKKHLGNRYLPYFLDVKSRCFYLIENWVSYVSFASKAAEERAKLKTGNELGKLYLEASLEILDYEMDFEGDMSDAQEIQANEILYLLLKKAEKYLDVPTSELYEELAMACSILGKGDEEDHYDELAIKAEELEKKD